MAHTPDLAGKPCSIEQSLDVLCHAIHVPCAMLAVLRYALMWGSMEWRKPSQKQHSTHSAWSMGVSKYRCMLLPPVVVSCSVGNTCSACMPTGYDQAE